MKKTINGTTYDLPDPAVWHFQTVEMIGKSEDGSQKRGKFKRVLHPIKKRWDWVFLGAICPRCERVWNEIICRFCGFQEGK